MRALIAEIDRDYEAEVREHMKFVRKNSGRVTKYADGSVCFHHDREGYEDELHKLFEEIAKERKLHYQKIFDLIKENTYKDDISFITLKEISSEIDYL